MILVWLIVRKHARTLVAFVAGLLFAIHPLAVESVTWIAGGVVYSYAAFFFLLSLYWYRNVSLVGRILSLLSFILALGMSDKALPLFIIFGLYEWMFGDLKKHWKQWVPYIVVTIPFVLFYTTRIGSRISGVEDITNQQISGLYNPLLQLPFAISWYAQLFVWPKHLTLYHVGLFHSWTEVVIRMVATGVYLGVTLVGLVRKKSWGFWLAWVVLTLGVTLLPIHIAWIVAERYVYLGFIGFCVVSGMLYDRIVSSKKWGVAVIGMCVGIIAVIALCTRTMLRGSEWRSQDSLWVATLRESPEEPKSWNNMGDVYARHGEYDKSIEALTQAIKINPQYADAYHNIGNTYIQMKKYDEAMPYLKKSLSMNPNMWQSYQDLAVIAAEKKDYQQALEYIEKALKINPTDALLQQNAQTLQRAIREQ
ncbi:MAG: tetratricopeptide repeat protein [Candidatus Gottesmanbacteria bacterium]|nr:tetratricopeptide repeat protein [Candidatus Gottesmanbacteria bacterium]